MLSSDKKRSLWISKLNQVLGENLNAEQKNAVLALISILTEDLFSDIQSDKTFYENEKILQWLDLHASAFNAIEGKLIFGTLNDYSPSEVTAIIRRLPSQDIPSFQEFMQLDYEMTIANNPDKGAASSHSENATPRYNFCDDPCDCSCSCRWGTFCIGADSCFEKCGDCGAGLGCGFIYLQTCFGLCNDVGPTGS